MKMLHVIMICCISGAHTFIAMEEKETVPELQRTKSLSDVYKYLAETEPPGSPRATQYEFKHKRYNALFISIKSADTLRKQLAQLEKPDSPIAADKKQPIKKRLTQEHQSRLAQQQALRKSLKKKNYHNLYFITYNTHFSTVTRSTNLKSMFYISLIF